MNDTIVAARMLAQSSIASGCYCFSSVWHVQGAKALGSPPSLKMAAACRDAQHAWPAGQAQLQQGERLDQPAYTKGKVSRPMIQRTAGSGVFYRVNIISECSDQIEVYYPPFEADPDFREWVWRTSDRIHRATNGKWSYVGRGGWRYNVKGSKKRGRKGEFRVLAHIHSTAAGELWRAKHVLRRSQCEGTVHRLPSTRLS